jgi:hypothetical protein
VIVGAPQGVVGFVVMREAAQFIVLVIDDVFALVDYADQKTILIVQLQVAVNEIG